MAPEQLDGRGAGPPADVYALAAISFEALSGKRPREGSTPLEIAHRIATEGAPDLLDVWPTAPKEAARVLKRGMALESEDRPGSAGEFAPRAGPCPRGRARGDDAEDALPRPPIQGRRSGPRSRAPAAAAAATPAAAQARARPSAHAEARAGRRGSAAAPRRRGARRRHSRRRRRSREASPRRRHRAGRHLRRARRGHDCGRRSLGWGRQELPRRRVATNTPRTAARPNTRTEEEGAQGREAAEGVRPPRRPHPPRSSRATPVRTTRLAAPS